MTAQQTAEDFVGRTVVDSDGSKIGKVGQVYLNDDSGQPEWVTVKTGMFGSSETFIPLQGAQLQGDQLVAAVSKDVVKGAPHVDPDGHTDEAEQDQLYDYYAGSVTQQTDGPTGDTPRAGDGRRDNAGEAGIYGRDTSGPTTDDAMTRSEERLHVGAERVEGGRARLRKYIVTENVSQTVPVQHEEVRITREPITDANRGDAMSGGDITEEEHEVTLHAERPVVSKETVPVERVRLGTETVTEQHQVTETLRKEQIDSPDVDSADADRNR
jgi:uncharacterized protein (TIGR02271 family)